MFIQNEEYNFQADRYIFLFCVTYWIVSDVFSRRENGISLLGRIKKNLHNISEANDFTSLDCSIGRKKYHNRTKGIPTNSQIQAREYGGFSKETPKNLFFPLIHSHMPNVVLLPCSIS